ncbi:MAG: hypothetical protein WBK19_16210 [Azonexus sp.]
MTENDKDPFGIGHWPKWKQIAVFVLAVLTVLGITGWIGENATALFDSTEAGAYKTRMRPLAEQLEKAQTTGDRPTALALAESTIAIVNGYNDLSDDQKKIINNSPLRYCVLAAVHLSSGPIEVMETGYWTSRPKYDAAVRECK